MFQVPLVKLGNTELHVSKLGFGTFDFGVPSLNISPDEGGRILAESSKLGIKFWDTADDYGSHPHVASALKHVPRRTVAISTKTYAKSGEEVEKSFKNSLKELNTDYIDIFMLHFVKFNQITDCPQVLRKIKDLKATDVVKAVGLSTHSVAVVRKASQFEELDVILATCCSADQALISKFQKRIPLEDGSIDEMFYALKVAHDNGKGIIAMKVLGNKTPPLIKNYEAAITAVARLDFVDSMLIGMQSLDEVKKNIKAIMLG